METNHIVKTISQDYASAFSRSAFTHVLDFADYGHFNQLASHYEGLTGGSYLDLLDKAYALVCDHYRFEYVYKNELLGCILSPIGALDLTCFSEFRVGQRIADLAVFHTESVAFEIKTAYDSPQRLARQMDAYEHVFDRCYIVVPEESVEVYTGRVSPATGIITMSSEPEPIQLTEVRQAQRNDCFNPTAIMPILRTSEYTRMAVELGASLNGIPNYDWYPFCLDVVGHADPERVRSLFIRAIRSRKNPTAYLTDFPRSIRQMLLSLNLPLRKATVLVDRLRSKISRTDNYDI